MLLVAIFSSTVENAYAYDKMLMFMLVSITSFLWIKACCKMAGSSTELSPRHAQPRWRRRRRATPLQPGPTAAASVPLVPDFSNSKYKAPVAIVHTIPSETTALTIFSSRIDPREWRRMRGEVCGAARRIAGRGQERKLGRRQLGGGDVNVEGKGNHDVEGLRFGLHRHLGGGDGDGDGSGSEKASGFGLQRRLVAIGEGVRRRRWIVGDEGRTVMASSEIIICKTLQ